MKPNYDLNSIGYNNWYTQLGNLKLYRIYEIGMILPCFGEKYFAGLEHGETAVYSAQTFDRIITIKNLSPLFFFDSNLFLTNYDIKNIAIYNVSDGTMKEINLSTRLTGASEGNKRIISNGKNKSTSLLNLKTNEIIWSFICDLEIPLQGNRIKDEFCFGRTADYVNKACWDTETGELLWKKSAFDFGDELEGAVQLGDSFVVNDLLIGWDYKQSIVHGLNYRTTEISWVRKFTGWLFWKLYADNTSYMISKYNKNEKSFIYTHFDNLTGVTLDQYDISRSLFYHLEYFGINPENVILDAPCVDNSYLYFGIGCQYYRMNKESYKIDLIISTHSRRFHTGRIIYDKLFITTYDSRIYVFESI